MPRWEPIGRCTRSIAQVTRYLRVFVRNQRHHSLVSLLLTGRSDHIPSHEADFYRMLALI